MRHLGHQRCDRRVLRAGLTIVLKKFLLVLQNGAAVKKLRRHARQNRRGIRAKALRGGAEIIELHRQPLVSGQQAAEHLLIILARHIRLVDNLHKFCLIRRCQAGVRQGHSVLSEQCGVKAHQDARIDARGAAGENPADRLPALSVDDHERQNFRPFLRRESFQRNIVQERAQLSDRVTLIIIAEQRHADLMAEIPAQVRCLGKRPEPLAVKTRDSKAPALSARKKPVEPGDARVKGREHGNFVLISGKPLHRAVLLRSPAVSRGILKEQMHPAPIQWQHGLSVLHHHLLLPAALVIRHDQLQRSGAAKVRLRPDEAAEHHAHRAGRILRRQDIIIQHVPVEITEFPRHMLMRKLLHGECADRGKRLPVNLRILLPVMHDIGIHLRRLPIGQRALIAEISQHNLRNFPRVVLRHRQNIILKQPCQRQLRFHAPRVPDKALRRGPVSPQQKRHNIPQRLLLQNIPVIRPGENPVQPLGIVLGARRECIDLRHDLHINHIHAGREGQHLKGKLIGL